MDYDMLGNTKETNVWLQEEQINIPPPSPLPPTPLKLFIILGGGRERGRGGGETGDAWR